MGNVKLNQGTSYFSDFSMVTACMIYANAGGFKDPLKQNLALEFCRNQNNDFSILTETHINHDQIHHVINNWSGPIFFSPGESHTKGLLVTLYPGIQGVTEVDTDPKRRFKVTPSNDRDFSVCAPFSRHTTREQLARGTFL